MAIKVTPPPGFRLLQHALDVGAHKELINVIGVVAFVERSPGHLGTDDSLNIVLQDPSLVAGDETSTFSIKFYIKRGQEAPPIHDTGNVVTLRQIRYLNQGFMASFHTTALVYKLNQNSRDALNHPEKLDYIKYVEKAPVVALDPSKQETDYVRFLFQWQSESKDPTNGPARNGLNSRALAVPPMVQQRSNGKFALLSDVQPQKFYDITVEVIRCYHGDLTSTIYVTDYTTNNFFYNYETKNHDDFSYEWNANGKQEWQGPLGRMALQITVWPPNSDFLINSAIGEGSLINLKNVNIAHHKSAFNILEGKLHGDRLHVNKIHVSMAIEASQTCKNLLARKEAYRMAAMEKPMDLKPAETRKSKKKRAKHKKRQEKKELEEMERGLAARNMSLNSHVETGFDDKVLQSIRSVLGSPHLQGTNPENEDITYPFINVCFKAQVRVVDFFPSKLEDFTHDLDDAEYNDLHSEDDMDVDMDDSQPKRWEWAFWLLVEDVKGNPKGEPERMKVLVAGQDAEYLLQLDACDLRDNPQTLAQLKEKLFVLWGELAEGKGREANGVPVPAANKAFECCIKEYGVAKADGGWSRLHRMFHTTIK